MASNDTVQGQLKRLGIEPPTLARLSVLAGYHANYLAWARCTGRLTAQLVRRAARVLRVDRTTARVILGLPGGSK